MFEDETDVGPGHRETAHHILARGVLGARRAQELAARGHLAEQVLDPDAGSGRQGRRTILGHHAMVGHPLPALVRAARAALDG
ncbi:hypothetical protein MBENS4_3899 [Novosphingobium sp. MBES04]|nr:hypothetical protein MBENS4_3899 [Novosphingobium sp. MBES04]